MIIDFHTHIFSPQIKQNRGKYVARDPCFALLYSSAKAKLATAEELIASMDEEGIDISVVLNIGWTSQEQCVETNDYILESVTRYPKRLVGFGVVPPRLSQATLDEVERCAKEGMRGIGEMRLDTQSADLEDEGKIGPLIEKIIEHNLILLIHASEPVGHNYPGKGAVSLNRLYSLMTAFPDLTIVYAHWGGGLPFYALMPEVKRVMSKVFFDTAASPLLYRRQIYRQVCQLVGADKILFGSDYPLLAPGRLLKEINSLDLSEEAVHLILAGNAQQLLGIKNESDKA